MIRPQRGFNLGSATMGKPSQLLDQFTQPMSDGSHGDMGFYRHEGVYFLACACDKYMKHKWCEHTKEVYTAGTEIIFPTPIAIQVYVKPWLQVVVTLDDGDGYFVKVFVTGAWTKGGGEWRHSRAVEIAMTDSSPTLQELRREVLGWLPALPYVQEPLMVCSSVLVHGDLDWSDIGESRDTQRNAFNLFDTRRCVECDDLVYMDSPE